MLEAAGRCLEPFERVGWSSHALVDDDVGERDDDGADQQQQGDRERVHGGFEL